MGKRTTTRTTKAAQKTTPKFKVSVVYRAAPGYEECLHKVMALLLHSITNAKVSKENREGASTSNSEGKLFIPGEGDCSIEVVWE